jgi:chromosome partitioning protein
MRIATVNTKGGVGKTTTAVYLAAGLHEMGRTFLVDADPQESAELWSKQDPGLPFTVATRASDDIGRWLAEAGRGYEHIVIDTPPGNLRIIAAAVKAVDLVLVPVAPTGLDINRMRPTFELLADLEAVHPVDVGVLLTKTRARTVSARAAREILAELGYPVLDTEIPLAEMYAGSFGTLPSDLGRYADLITELKS